MRHPFKSFLINAPRNGVKISKKILREEIIVATKDYLDSGGIIEVLPTLPSPSTPSVGGRDWTWEDRVGYGGFFGTDEWAETDAMEAELLRYELD